VRNLQIVDILVTNPTMKLSKLLDRKETLLGMLLHPDAGTALGAMKFHRKHKDSWASDCPRIGGI